MNVNDRSLSCCVGQDDLYTADAFVYIDSRTAKRITATITEFLIPRDDRTRTLAEGTCEVFSWPSILLK